jgi:hypothetical protein
MEYANPEVKQDQVDAVKAWRKQGNLFLRQSINRKITSYGLKHIAERDLGMYISNDSFIEAMQQQGFKAQRINYSPNYYFNVILGARLKTIRNGAEYVPAYKQA